MASADSTAPAGVRPVPVSSKADQSTGDDETYELAAQQRLGAVEGETAATWRMVVPATNAASPTGSSSEVSALAQSQTPSVLRYSSREVKQKILAALDSLDDPACSKWVRRSAKLALQGFQGALKPDAAMVVLQQAVLESSFQQLQKALPQGQSSDSALVLLIQHCMGCDLSSFLPDGTGVRPPPPGEVPTSVWLAVAETYLLPAAQLKHLGLQVDRILEGAGVENAALPLHQLIQESWRAVEQAETANSQPGSPAQRQEEPSPQQRLIVGLFGWMTYTTAGFLHRDPSKCWFINLFLDQPADGCETEPPATAESASLIGDDERWSQGCRPVFEGGRLTAIVLCVPLVRGTAQDVGSRSGTKGLRREEETVTVSAAPVQTGAWREDDRLQGQNHEVHCTEFVLTRERALFFAKAMKGAKGVVLAAPAGVGKTECVLALAAMLTVGAGGSVVYLPVASMLATGTPIAALRRELLRSFGALSCDTDFTDPKLQRQLLDLHQAQDHDAVLTAFLGLKDAFLGQDPGPTRAGRRMIIMDDVHALLSTVSAPVAEAAPSQDGTAAALLSTGISTGVVATIGPDLRAFEQLDTTSDTQRLGLRSAVSDSDVVELGGFSAGVVMEMIGSASPGPRAGAGAGGGGGGSFLQLSSAAREFVASTEFVELVEVFVEYSGGSAGALQTLVKVLSGASDLCHGNLRAVFRSALQEWDTVLRDWLCDQASLVWGAGQLNPLHVPFRVLKRLYAATRLEAPAATYAGGKVKNPFHQTRCAIAALERAVLALQVKHLKLLHPGEHSCEVFERMGVGRKVAPHFTITEHLACSIVHMGRTGANFIPLSPNAGQPPRWLLAGGSLSTDWQAAGEAVPAASWPVDQNGSEATLTFDLSDVAQVHGLKPGEKVVSKTCHNFPKTDCLVVGGECLEGGGTSWQMAFEEITEQSLGGHASRSTFGNPDVRGLTHEEAQKMLSGAPRDLACLIADKKWFLREHEGGSVEVCDWFKALETNRPGVEECVSLATAILHARGIPLNVQGYVGRGDGGKPVLHLDKTIAVGEDRGRISRRVREALRRSSPQPEGAEPAQVPPHPQSEATGGAARGGLASSRRPEAEECEPGLLSKWTEPEDLSIFFVYCSMTPNQGRGIEIAKAQTAVPGYFALTGNACYADHYPLPAAPAAVPT